MVLVYLYTICCLVSAPSIFVRTLFREVYGKNGREGGCQSIHVVDGPVPVVRVSVFTFVWTILKGLIQFASRLSSTKTPLSEPASCALFRENLALFSKRVGGTPTVPGGYPVTIVGWLQTSRRKMFLFSIIFHLPVSCAKECKDLYNALRRRTIQGSLEN